MSEKPNAGGMRSGRPNRTEAELKKGVFAHRIKDRYSTLWPLLIILGTLMATTTRDLWTFRSLKRDIVRQNAEAQPLLARSGEEIIVINSLKDDIIKLSYSDPVAAKILVDFFPGTAPTKISSPDALPPGNGVTPVDTGTFSPPVPPPDATKTASQPAAK